MWVRSRLGYGLCSWWGQLSSTLCKSATFAVTRINAGTSSFDRVQSGVEILAKFSMDLMQIIPRGERAMMRAINPVLQPAEAIVK